MVRAAGIAQTLTMVLPFRGLTLYFEQERGQNEAEKLSRSLGTDIATFASSNFEARSGKVRKHSFMDQSKDIAVGVLIETQRIFMDRLAEAFWNRSILAIPPFSLREIERFWAQKTGASPAEDTIRKLEDVTGGAPLFLDLVFNCYKEFPDLGLIHAINQAKRVVEKKPVDEPNRLGSVINDWNFHIETVEKRFSDGVLSNRTLLLELRHAQRKPFNAVDNQHLVDWLESGLVWPMNVHGGSALRAFEDFPFIKIHRIPTLAALAIAHITGDSLFAREVA